MRLRRAWIVSGWLLCQASALVITTIALSVSLSTDAAADECTCDHGNGMMCPMHHTRTPSKSRCAYRGTADDASTIASLLSQVAVVPASTVTLEPLTNTLTTPWRDPGLVVEPLGFDPPPPRA